MAQNLNILVLLREVCDPKPPANISAGGGSIYDRGLRRLPNPADLVALEEALRLAETVGGRVTALAVGPGSLDDLLRLAGAMGAARAIRVWDHALEDGDPIADSALLGRLQEILKPDLFLSGNRLLDKGDDPALRLAAARKGIPCVPAAVALTLKGSQARIERKSDRGARQQVLASLPCTVLFEADAGEVRYPSHQAVMEALDATIENWGLAELGLPARSVGAAGAALRLAEFAPPRQQPLRVVTPDAQLPAFERILALLSGGIKPREGKMTHESAAGTADKLWKIFQAEGLVPEESK
jgi:electron transfer flavoprotein beta subunit